MQIQTPEDVPQPAAESGSNAALLTHLAFGAAAAALPGILLRHHQSALAGAPVVLTAALFTTLLALGLGAALARIASRAAFDKTGLIFVIGTIVTLPLRPDPISDSAIVATPVQDLLLSMFQSGGLTLMLLTAAVLLPVFKEVSGDAAASRRWFHLQLAGGCLGLFLAMVFPGSQTPPLWQLNGWSVLALIAPVAAAFNPAFFLRPNKIKTASDVGAASGAGSGLRLLSGLTAGGLIAGLAESLIRGTAAMAVIVGPLLLVTAVAILFVDRRCRRLSPPMLFLAALPAVLMVAATWYVGEMLSTGMSIALFSLSAGLAITAVHGHAARLAAETRWPMLEVFGGVAGVGLVLLAPLVLQDFFEIPFLLSLLLLASWAGGFLLKENVRKPKALWKGSAAVLAVAIMAGMAYVQFISTQGYAHHSRNIHGTLSVLPLKSPDEGIPYARLIANQNLIGGEVFLSNLKSIPQFQRAPDTGLAFLFRQFPKGNYRKIGVVGLNDGSLTAYADPTDALTFYEINPALPPVAKEYFTFLENAQVKYKLELSNVRRSLEKAGEQEFDLLIIDAIHRGSLGTHLLTREAFETYKQHLLPTGVMAVNLSGSRYDLLPVVWRQAIENEWEMIPIFTGENNTVEWVLMTANQQFLSIDTFQKIVAAIQPESREAAREFPLWTDAYQTLPNAR